MAASWERVTLPPWDNARTYLKPTNVVLLVWADVPSAARNSPNEHLGLLAGGAKLHVLGQACTARPRRNRPTAPLA